MIDVKTNKNTDYTDSLNLKQDVNSNIIEITKFSLPKRKTQSTPILSYVYTNQIRRDVFGEEIKKGGKHKISFADNALLIKNKNDENNENNVESKLDNIVEVIDVECYKEENKLNVYKSNEIPLDDVICCNSCMHF
jgi:hypothetical protein